VILSRHSSALDANLRTTRENSWISFGFVEKDASTRSSGGYKVESHSTRSITEPIERIGSAAR
jgi:hypothetical protein